MSESRGRCQRLARCGCLLAVATGLAVLVPGGSTLAHHPWVLVMDKGDDTQWVRLGWGHAFPDDGPLADERVGRLEHRLPDGDIKSLEPKSGREGAYAISIEQSGIHRLVLWQEPGYWTRTPRGGERAPRSEVSDGVECSRSHNTARKVIVHGASDHGEIGEEWSLGERLEILLAEGGGPAPEPGAPVPLQVLADGEPVELELALYAPDGGSEAVRRVATDGDGRAEIEPYEPGEWLVHAQYTQSYPDPERCDYESFNATLVLEVSK